MRVVVSYCSVLVRMQANVKFGTHSSYKTVSAECFANKKTNNRIH